jgi:thiol:disulfide interchange protein
LKVKRAIGRAWALTAFLAGVLAGAPGCSGRHEDSSTSPAARDHSQGSSSSSSLSLPFSSLTFDEALVQARAEKKLVFVDLYADWCGWCTKMDLDVFTDARVKSALLGYVPIKVNVEVGGGRDVASRYRVNGLPAFLVLNGDGQLVGRFDGYLPAETFLARLGRSSGARG